MQTMLWAGASRRPRPSQKKDTFFACASVLPINTWKIAQRSKPSLSTAGSGLWSTSENSFGKLAPSRKWATSAVLP
jgi:hypothetical protein